jgi:hypothetical protein
MMTKPKNPFDNFTDALVDELIAMADDQVLDGLDPAAVQAEGLEVLKAAKVEAGRRRLAAAKAGVAVSKVLRAAVGEPSVSVAEARRYLSQAANDSRYTLAARSLGDLSDDEVLRLYAQMKTLEAADGNNGASQ